jgi:hypothetical protein
MKVIKLASVAAVESAGMSLAGFAAAADLEFDSSEAPVARTFANGTLCPANKPAEKSSAAATAIVIHFAIGRLPDAMKTERTNLIIRRWPKLPCGPPRHEI